MFLLKTLFRGLMLSSLGLMVACTTVKQEPLPSVSPEKTDVTFYEQKFAELPEASSQEWAQSLSAFVRSCRSLAKKPAWEAVCEKARVAPPSTAQSFFQDNFAPWLVLPEGKNGQGMMTGYFEPLLYGSRTKRAPFVYPIYGVPDDLLVIDLSSIYPKLKGLRLRGKLQGRKVVPYDSRGQIQERTDLDQWALAWVDDPVSAFFLQVQGSGRILLPDGTFMHVGFADQNGYRYRSIGNWLIKHGHLKPHELSMQSIRAWARKHPDQVKEALAQNPSYIFFTERSANGADGPIGAQGIPLTPKTSVAVDPRYWQLGTPFFVTVNQERPKLSFSRPVIAQDTGGAIRGPLRFDYFWGFGDEAGEAAGRQKSQVRAWILVPKGLNPDDVRTRRK